MAGKLLRQNCLPRTLLPALAKSCDWGLASSTEPSLVHLPDYDFGETP